jgi:hypothetical protein
MHLPLLMLGWLITMTCSEKAAAKSLYERWLAALALGRLQQHPDELNQTVQQLRQIQQEALAMAHLEDTGLHIITSRSVEQHLCLYSSIGSRQSLVM